MLVTTDSILQLYGGNDDDVLDGGPNVDFCLDGLGNDTVLACK